jgi:large subunit ribosomal protein L10
MENPRPEKVAVVGGDLKVYKNTLVRFAARDLGLEIEDLLTGPTAIAFVDGDPVNVAKALRDFARTNPALVVKGGLLGNRSLTAAETQALADVEPREVLLAKLAGAMAAPMQQLAGLLQALPRNLAYGLQAVIDQKNAEES